MDRMLFLKGGNPLPDGAEGKVDVHRPRGQARISGGGGLIPASN